MADRELIDSFLAGRLPGRERDDFEARIVAEPALLRELELTGALREGLETLESRGKLAPLLSGTRAGWLPAFATAASVVAGLAGLTALVLYQQLERARDALATADRASLHGAMSAPVGLVTVRLMQLRGTPSEPDRSWQRPARATMVDLRFDPGLSPADTYAVRISRVQRPADMPVLALQRVATGADGELSVLLHSGLLSPGEYRIDLEPSSAPDGSAAQSLQFTLRVVD